MSSIIDLEKRVIAAANQVAIAENMLNGYRESLRLLREKLEEAKRGRDEHGNLLDIRLLEEGDTARLPFNDLRLLPNGRLVVHPESTNILQNFKDNDILVQKILGGLKVIVKHTGWEGPKVELYSHLSSQTLRQLDKEWNRVVAVEEKG